MASKASNENLMWWTIGGLILFWLIVIPAAAVSKPFGGVPKQQ